MYSRTSEQASIKLNRELQSAVKHLRTTNIQGVARLGHLQATVWIAMKQEGERQTLDRGNIPLEQERYLVAEQD